MTARRKVPVRAALRRRLGFPRGRRDVVLRLWIIAWLTFVWVLLWGTVSAANIVGGIVVALLILGLLPLPRVPVRGKLHPLSALRLAGRIAVDLLLSSVQVAWLSVRPGRPPLTAILRVPTSIRSDLVLSLFVDAINLVPGTVVIEIDRIRRYCYIHVLDASGPEALDRFHRNTRRLEELFVAAFERPEDLNPREPEPEVPR